MSSRRGRKRERRLADASGHDASPRGDRPRAVPNSLAEGFGGTCGLWVDASRSDLLLLRKAIKEYWPVLVERRGPIIEEIAQLLFSEQHRENPSRILVVVRALAAADKHDLDLEMKALAEETRLGPSNPPPSKATR